MNEITYGRLTYPSARHAYLAAVTLGTADPVQIRDASRDDAERIAAAAGRMMDEDEWGADIEQQIHWLRCRDPHFAAAHLVRDGTPMRYIDWWSLRSVELIAEALEQMQKEG